MTDYSELKRLAEAAMPSDDSPNLPCTVAFDRAASPAAVLDLIAENEQLGRYLCTCRDCGGEGSLHTGDWHSYSHMEPPEPVMEKCGECDGTGLLGEIQDLYQVITERDQLKADNEVARMRIKELDLLFGRYILAMRAAIIEAERGNGLIRAVEWIFNSLAGPGELPPEDETDAQAYFDREIVAVDNGMQEVLAFHDARRAAKEASNG